MIGQRLGDFELVEELGRGSMGAVYAALRCSDGHRVALKVLAPGLAASEEFVQRFEREARATARLDHPGIVAARDLGHDESVYYFTMQLVSGRSLEDLLLDYPRLEPSWVSSLGIQVARALGYAHGEGLLHRDVKPGNLLIDEGGRCLVTDFGIALAEAESRLTRTGQRLGSPDYTAPEIIRGEPVDGRSDLYSLGIVLFQTLTGELPYRGASPFDVFALHVEGPLARTRDLDAAIPETLDRIVARLMARNPDDRHQTGEELAEDLLRSTGGEVPALSLTPAAAPARAPRAPAPETHRPARFSLTTVGLAVLGSALALYLVAHLSCG